jgi:hypothetical protein
MFVVKFQLFEVFEYQNGALGFEYKPVKLHDGSTERDHFESIEEAQSVMNNSMSIDRNKRYVLLPIFENDARYNQSWYRNR